MSESKELIPVFIQWRKGDGTEFHQLKPHSAPMDRGRVVHLPDHDKPIYFYRMFFRNFDEMRLVGYYAKVDVIEVNSRFFRLNAPAVESANQVSSL